MPRLSEFDLTVSIVLYNTDKEELEHTIKLLNSSPLKIKTFLVDNSRNDCLRAIAEKLGVEYIFNNSNLGYGKGHNVAIRKSASISKYHLVMNSDVDFDPYILVKAFNYMEKNADIGMLSPKIKLFNGEMQHSCRLLPTPFDLFARRFIPNSIKPLFRKKLNDYILSDRNYSKPMNVPNLPGCFMFMRLSDLMEVNGFDESIFLYVEDVDLTRRLHQITKTIYYPEIEINHGLARESYKLTKLVLYHINSAIYYFNKWGWFFDKKRAVINKQLLTETETATDLYNKPALLQVVK